MAYFPGSTAYFPESTAYFPESKSILPRVTKILPRPRWIECNTSQSLICQEVLGGSQWSSDHWPPPYINGLWLVNCGNLLGLFRSFLHFFIVLGLFTLTDGQIRLCISYWPYLSVLSLFLIIFGHFRSFSTIFCHFLSFLVILTIFDCFVHFNVIFDFDTLISYQSVFNPFLVRF